MRSPEELNGCRTEVATGLSASNAISCSIIRLLSRWTGYGRLNLGSAGRPPWKKCHSRGVWASLAMISSRDSMRSFFVSVLLLVVAGGAPALAQTPSDTPSDTTPSTATMFPHPAASWWWLSGQVNLISQAHGRFPSPYQGDNSFRPQGEHALSRLWTIYTGVSYRAIPTCWSTSRALVAAD